jgi:hypothetical protein
MEKSFSMKVAPNPKAKASPNPWHNLFALVQIPIMFIEKGNM